jgi:outer membrane protein assembly factor BamB
MPRGKLALRLSLLACCAAALAGTAPAGNWPRFRGPNGSGVADDKGIPVRWDAQAGVLWKVALPGLGNSSPVVWGERLFVQTASPDGRERRLLCLDTRTGKTLWSRAMPGARAKTHPKNTLASSTPATDGQRVYAAFWDGKDIELAAFDLDGKQAWSRNLGTFTSQHGAGASPVVYGDKVYFANDQDGTSTLLAFNKKDGTTAWEAGRPAYRACYSSPMLRREPGAAPELLVISTMEFTGYDPQTGGKDWAWHWKFTAPMPLRTTGSPVYADGTLFACSGDGGGPRHMVAVKLDGHGKDTRSRLLWENKKDFPYVPTILVRDGHLYFVNDRGVAGCFEAQTGKRVWLERLSGDSFISSPVLVDGRIYAASEGGEVFVLAAEPTFRLLARNPLGEGIRATPAVAGGRLFLRGEQHLYCIGGSGARAR